MINDSVYGSGFYDFVRNLENKKRRAVRGLDTEVVELSELLGRVCSTDVYAPNELPRMKRSKVIGYAVRTSDIRGASTDQPVRLFAKQEHSSPISAGYGLGSDPETMFLGPNSFIIVYEGFPLPEEADLVIYFYSPKAALFPTIDGRYIDVFTDHFEESNIVSAGEYINKNSIIVHKATRIASADISKMVASGIDKVSVYKVPKIGIVVGTRELRAPAQANEPGKTPDFIGPYVSSMLEEWGLKSVAIYYIDLNRDTKSTEIRSRIDEYVALHDVLITCADRDDMHAATTGLGESLSFARFNIGCYCFPGKLTHVFTTQPRSGSRREIVPIYDNKNRLVAQHHVTFNINTHIINVIANFYDILVSLVIYARPLINDLEGALSIGSPWHYGVINKTIKRNEMFGTFIFCKKIFDSNARIILDVLYEPPFGSGAPDSSIDAIAYISGGAGTVEEGSIVQWTSIF